MKLKTEFDFDSAHRLVGHKGLCSNLHGHMWHVELEIEGGELDEIGILWDFGDRKLLEKMFDHKTILKYCPENADIGNAIERICGKDSVVWLENNPTAEHLCTFILNHLKRITPTLKFKIKIYESPKSYAEGEL